MTTKKILIYDGTCSVCTLARDAVAVRDTHETFELVDAHSEEGRALRAQHQLDTEKSAYLIDGDVIEEQSDMALAVLKELGWFERTLARIGQFIPRVLRNALYRFIARNRRFFNTHSR